MLLTLRISDFAIIEEIEVQFDPGLNVLTGQTGAGKSIIVDALGLLRGGRGHPDWVRGGASQATVEAMFDISELSWCQARLEAAGLPAGDELVVRRIVPRSGRGRCYVNGSLCSMATLARITDGLVDISSQHESQTLTQAGTQRDIVDALGAPAKTLNAMADCYRKLREFDERLRNDLGDEQARLERLDFLRFQLDELERARLKAGEEEQLTQEQGRLAHAHTLRETATAAESALYSSDRAVVETLAAQIREVSAQAQIDAALQPFVEQMQEAQVLLEDAANGLGRYASAVAVDPQRLADLEERLALIHRLTRKHAATVEALIEKRDALATECSDLEHYDDRLATLQAEVASAREQAANVAAKLTVARKRTAKKLSKQVTELLGQLQMDGAQLQVEVRVLPAKEGDERALQVKSGGEQRRLSAHGWDRVELLVSTNQGEDPKPLGRVASGGELSRILLAIRHVLGRKHRIETTVFDEVDSGISGSVADTVGATLAEIADHGQILVVTHLPQVAAYADRHFEVSKRTTKGRTSSAIAELDIEARVEALARMLGTRRVTDQARANARQLLISAGQTASTN